MAIVTSSGASVRTGCEHQPGWRAAIKAAIRDSTTLCRRLDLPQSYGRAAKQGEQAFRVFAPLEYVARMVPGDPHDPLLRQVLPLAEEHPEVGGFSFDPVAESMAQLHPGLLKKYNGRVLMITTGACAVHCRYCFRRHFPYGESPKSTELWEPALQRIEEDPTLDEVLLSGGDPLTLTDNVLADLAQRLARIPHLRRLRIHTRLPIVIPQRVTEELVGWLRGTRLTPLVVVHANHPAELDRWVSASLARLVDSGIVVLNQAVLLRGVNDAERPLIELCRRLADLRVLPYYLHQLDRVAGAAHFEVPVARGRKLIERLRAELPGYAVPRYVREIAGAPSKEVLA